MRRTPLRRRGRVAERTEAVRQEFLRTVFEQSEMVVHGDAAMARSFCGAAVGEGGKVYRHPIGSGATVQIMLTPAGKYATGILYAHVHHLDGRNHGGREQGSNLVLLSRARHEAITAYEKGTGKRWEFGCGV